MGVHVPNTSFTLECIWYTLHEMNRYIITLYYQRNELNLSRVFLVVNYVFILKKREENRPLFSNANMILNPEHEILRVFSPRKILGIVKKIPIFICFFKPLVSFYARCRGLFGIADYTYGISWTLNNSLKSILTCWIYYLQIKYMYFVLDRFCEFFLYTL